MVKILKTSFQNTAATFSGHRKEWCSFNFNAHCVNRPNLNGDLHLLVSMSLVIAIARTRVVYNSCLEYVALHRIVVDNLNSNYLILKIEVTLLHRHCCKIVITWPHVDTINFEVLMSLCMSSSVVGDLGALKKHLHYSFDSSN